MSLCPIIPSERNLNMVSQYVPYTIKFFEECMQLQQIKHGNSLIHRLTPGKPKLTPIIYVG